MNDTPSPSPTAEPAEPDSLGSRLTNVFVAPGEVFDRVKSAPFRAANYVVPALLLLLVGWLSSLIVFSQPAIRQQLAELAEQGVQRQIDRGRIPAAQAEAARTQAAKFSDLGARIGAGVVPVVAGFVGPLWWGLILWLVGAKALKGSFPYMKAVEVASLANLIGVLETVVRTLLIVIMGNLFAGPNPAMLVTNFDAQNPLHGSLASLDLIGLWTLAVRGVGLASLSGRRLGVGLAWVFGLWIVYRAGALGLGIAMQRVFGG